MSAVELIREGRTARVVMNRPEVHNAFDDALIADLTAAIDELERDDAVRAVVLTGAGASFSAGADLNWMRGMAAASEADNLADSLRLAALMRRLQFLSKPTVARVNGAAFGGGVGLIACCDIAVAVDGARFALSEVKLGLVPAVISPYVVGAIGLRQARRLFITGEIFDSAAALAMDLVHEVVPAEALDGAVDRLLGLLGKGGPVAQREAKRLALGMGNQWPERMQEVDAANAGLIARLRVSPEGQDGLSAFLDKTPPSWLR
ncbi:MAG: enoyl-CoA hydratase-related protein [Luteibacter sp.]